MAKGIDISCTYVQDEQRNVVSAQRSKAIRDLMLSSFRRLQTQGVAPGCIGQVVGSFTLLHNLISHFRIKTKYTLSITSMSVFTQNCTVLCHDMLKLGKNECTVLTS
ncbi:hypothetical protein BDR06DRAFT_1015747 [Suillus hirtellus]|nr:hypothetical protein BDR06DRAFT_1015747 [Suillus hirtellus]